MEINGPDIQNYFTTHSTRSAASSRSESIEVSHKENIKCAGWKSDETLTEHYEKQIEKELDIRIQQGLWIL